MELEQAQSETLRKHRTQEPASWDVFRTSEKDVKILSGTLNTKELVRIALNGSTKFNDRPLSETCIVEGEVRSSAFRNGDQRYFLKGVDDNITEIRIESGDNISD